MVGLADHLWMKEVSKIVTRSLGHGRKSGWEQVIGRAD
jgi:hypothetical protein